MHTDGHRWIVRWWFSGLALSVFICVNLCSFFPLLNLFVNRDIYINRTPMHTDGHRWIVRWWFSGVALSVFICVNLCSFFPLLNLFVNYYIFSTSNTDAYK
ncbi:hypothetical protein [Fischerella sp. JS2]|uniref:hypothetical protein n=1 Tax=Fischerella sp. JS2 TaxID=2597771 RepID=UPI0028F0BA43|nr:hypothetical protein [Fischerella sp. JS2]